MITEMKIFTEQLRGGSTETISLSVSPSFLQIQEKELQFTDPVLLEGKVYATETDLIFQCHLQTKVRLPCSICNQMIQIDLDTGPLYQTVPLSDLSSSIYDYSEWAREEILLLVPQFIECTPACPKREEIKKYFTPPTSSTQFPFSGL